MAQSLCNTCFWCSAGGWCTKAHNPVKHKDPVTNCENYASRLGYGDDDRNYSGLLEE